MKHANDTSIMDSLEYLISRAKVLGVHWIADALEDISIRWTTTTTEKLIAIKKTLDSIQDSQGEIPPEIDKLIDGLIQAVDDTMWEANNPPPWRVIDRLLNIGSKLFGRDSW